MTQYFYLYRLTMNKYVSDTFCLYSQVWLYRHLLIGLFTGDWGSKSCAQWSGATILWLSEFCWEMRLYYCIDHRNRCWRSREFFTLHDILLFWTTPASEMATCHSNQQAYLPHSKSIPAGSLEYLRRPTHSLYPRVHCRRSGIIEDPPSHILTRCPLVGTYLEWWVCHCGKTLGTWIRRCCLKVSNRKSCFGSIDIIMHHWVSLAAYIPLVKKETNTRFWVELRKGQRQKQPRVRAWKS